MSKATDLLSILPRRPVEFLDRVAAAAQVKLDQISRRRPPYATTDWDMALEGIGKSIGQDLAPYLHEAELHAVEEQVVKRIASMPENAPFESFHNGDLRLGRLAYALGRCMKPRVIVETGTCYGVSSSFFLKALKTNNCGVLHSVDLPPLGRWGDQFIGALIPNELRCAWKLHRGSSRRLLPGILAHLGKIDLFLHDSLHTYGNILMECRTVAPHLNRPAVVIVDDVQDNAAFLDWIGASQPDFYTVVSELQKNALLGVAVFK